MERNDDELTLEGLDDQIEWHARGPRALPPGGQPSPTTRLIQGLRRSYENEQADEQSVEAVWQRLAESGNVPAPLRQRSRQSRPRQSQPATWQPPLQNETHSRRWSLASRLTAIAAAVVLVVVIGGLTAGLILVRQPKVGTPSQATATPGHTVTATAAPSPPSEIAYIGSDGNVWEMTWPGGTPEQLTTDASIGQISYSGLTWSPDGTLLAALRQAYTNNPSMLIIKPDGTVVVHVPLPASMNGAIPFTWSPDSTMLAFRGNIVDVLPDGTHIGKLFIFDAQTGKTQKTLTYNAGGSGCGGAGPFDPLTGEIWVVHHLSWNYASGSTFIWSPDQHSILVSYVCGQARAALVDLNTGTTSLPYPSDGGYQPKGNLILGYWNDGTLGLTDLSANHVRALVKPEQYVNPQQYLITLGLAAWASDGQSIYYEHDDGIWQINVDGSNPHQVVAGTALDNQQNATVQLVPSPSPDGRMLLYFQATGSNRAVDSSDPTPQPTPTEPLTTRWYIAQADGTNPMPLPSGISDVVWRPAK